MTKDRQFTRDPRVLRSLQYFEAVARLGSIKSAAEENRVSASAVSHQIRSLKDFLGEEVLIRSGRGVQLTPTGEQLYQHVSRFLVDLDRTLEMTIGSQKQVIRLAVCSSFGPAWFAKRFPVFQMHFPTIDFDLRMYARDPSQTETVADVIVTADEVDAGFDAITLFEEMLVAVVSPNARLDDEGRPLHLITTDIERHNLAEDWIDFGAVTGQDYLAAAEISPIRCSHYLLAMALAQSGGGAALVPDFLAFDSLARKDLKLLRPEKVAANRIYKLCFKSSRAQDPTIRAIVGWMRAETKDGSLPS
jgi:LysR family glycine cleavage system transcriptional activator